MAMNYRSKSHREFLNHKSTFQLPISSISKVPNDSSVSTVQDMPHLSTFDRMQSDNLTERKVIDESPLAMRKQSSSLNQRSSSFLKKHRTHLSSTIEMNPKQNMGLQIRKSLDNIYLRAIGE